MAKMDRDYRRLQTVRLPALPVATTLRETYAASKAS